MHRLYLVIIHLFHARKEIVMKKLKMAVLLFLVFVCMNSTKVFALRDTEMFVGEEITVTTSESGSNYQWMVDDSSIVQISGKGTSCKVVARKPGKTTVWVFMTKTKPDLDFDPWTGTYTHITTTYETYDAFNVVVKENSQNNTSTPVSPSSSGNENESNIFSDRKITVNDYNNGECGLEAYNAYYDISGNLVVNLKIANNSGHKIKRLENLSVKVKASNGKTIATYKAKKYKISISNKKAKDIAIIIQKSDVKIKNANLRKAKIITNGRYCW